MKINNEGSGSSFPRKEYCLTIATQYIYLLDHFCITNPFKVQLESKKTIDFKKLAKEIATKAENIWELYKYIYSSNELGLITEDMTYGHNTLRKHLLLVTNVLMNDILSKTDRTTVGL